MNGKLSLTVVTEYYIPPWWFWSTSKGNKTCQWETTLRRSPQLGKTFLGIALQCDTVFSFLLPLLFTRQDFHEPAGSPCYRRLFSLSFSTGFPSEFLFRAPLLNICFQEWIYKLENDCLGLRMGKYRNFQWMLEKCSILWWLYEYIYVKRYWN